mmetsp:Transcript_135671/g.377893  ORF Transcript_135671/g.377893 Transcript_135671/m.377893 type:complete len:379 (+) Transcript_135671:66-1202(+)
MMLQSRMKMPRLDTGQYEMAFKVLVSPHAAGKIIGRGGSEITELRKQLNVGCHIHGPENPFPNTGCQIAVLFGSRANIDLAFEMVIGKIAEADAEMLQQGMQLTVVVVMTTNAVSAVIGTKGATIASLRQGAGCGFSADKELYQGEQLVRVTGPVERLPGALALLTPFVERSGDSLQYAMQEYSFAGAGWDGGWALGKAPLQAKGAGKRMSPPGPWQMPGMQAIAPGPLGRRRPASPVAWQPPKQARFVGPKGPAIGSIPPGELDWPELRETPVEEETALALTPGEVLGGIAAEEGTPSEDDPRVLGSPMAMAFPIPKDSIGRVLGRGGASSEEIRRATGVSLQIDPGETEGTVSLSGTLQAVQLAQRLVVARVLAKS